MTIRAILAAMLWVYVLGIALVLLLWAGAHSLGG